MYLVFVVYIDLFGLSKNQIIVILGSVLCLQNFHIPV